MSQKFLTIHPPDGHRSMPQSPLPSLKIEELSKCYENANSARLNVAVRLEKCFSDNCLFPKDSEDLQTASKSDGDISANVQDDEGDKEETGDTEKEEMTTVGNGAAQMTAEGLIVPKRLKNPCAESQERQRLHRELLLNQKIGRNVLNQKSELQKAMEKHKENQFKKELEASKQENMTPFEKVIEQRAKRLEILEKDVPEKEISSKEPEFLQIHAKLKAKMDAK